MANYGQEQTLTTVGKWLSGGGRLTTGSLSGGVQAREPSTRCGAVESD